MNVQYGTLESCDIFFMRLHPHILPDPVSAARQAAEFITDIARQCVKQHDRFLLAVSGGKTPSAMFEILATEDLPWSRLHIFQVDERIAPAGDVDRNLTALQADLLAHVPLTPQQIHAMPVEAHGLTAAACDYAQVLRIWGGSPPVFDLVHLGLGPDGHTASLVPGDPVLKVSDSDVALTRIYQGRRRMTLTYPFINRARHILWLVTGAGKAHMLTRLCAGDTRIPAGRIKSDNAIIFADESAGHGTA